MRIKPFGFLLVFLCGLPLPGQQAVPNLILDAGPSKTLARPSQNAERLPEGPPRLRTRPIELDLTAIDPDAPGAQGRGRRVRMRLFSDVDVEVVQERARRRDRERGFEWSGRPAGDGPGNVVLSVVDGRASGSIGIPQGFFQIRHVEGRLHEVTEVAYERRDPIDDAIVPLAAPLTAPRADAEKVVAAPPTASAAGDPILDVLVVYTPEARARLGGSQQIQDRILLAVAEANASFLNSSTAVEINLAGMAEISTAGTQSATSSYLHQVTFSEPEIESLRERYGADLVSVWIHNGSSAFVGIGWLNQGSPGFDAYAYSVVEVNFAAGPSYTFSHEAGHNLGGAHDRANAGSPGAFDYSYGYRRTGANGFFTIMSYSSGCSGCTPLNHWSNPNVLIDGVPSGVPAGQIDSADNALTLSNIAPSAAQFRAAQAVPPNSPPVAADQTLNPTSGVNTAMTLAGSDPDGDPLFFDITRQPQHGQLTGSGPNWTYTSDFGYSGPDSFEYQVRDSYGGFDVGVVTLNVQTAASTPPSVSLAQPAGGPFTAPAGIQLVATATDSDGVHNVEFFANGQLLGEAASQTSSFVFDWTDAPAGDFQLTAVAYDNLGVSATSSPVSITVQPGVGTGYTSRMARLFYAFDENGGPTVFDRAGARHAAVSGAASWTSLGLEGGWADAGAGSFLGNQLSAASGDAFTLVWVGRLGTASGYQTLFSMSGGGVNNVSASYYQPSGYIYLGLNGTFAGIFNAGPLLNKIAMVALRCSGGACAWRVGGSGPWMNATVGTGVASNPELLIGSDPQHWSPNVNTVSALFWVYADALTDPELDANFQYAGETLNARGGFVLDGYTAAPSNTPPSVTLAQPAGPFTAPANVALNATASDADGSIARVEFFAGGALLGSDSSAPYSFNWTGVASGTYSLVARAYDNFGASTDSSPVSVTVDPAAGGGGGGGADYTARAAQLFYAFDEDGGSTVFDQVGGRNAALGGKANWTGLGLQGGWADAGAGGFSGNSLSAASGDAFTLVWVGRLGTAGGYQTLFSMSGGGVNNISATYYQPSGYLYLGINNTFAGIYNAGALLNKIVMVALRCSGGACAWRVGGSGPWMNATVGTGVSPSPQLTVGADINRWSPQVNNTSALFWVYGDALTDPELDANFQYAGETLNARGGFVLDGFDSGGTVNTPPSVTLAQPAGPFTAPADIVLNATASDADGSIARVELVADGVLIGSDSTAPYAFNWTGVAAGTYSLVARAYDNLGASTGSSPVSVTVDAPAGAGYTTRAAQLFYAFDENGGSTVFDQVGGRNAALGGKANWTSLGLQGGWADAGAGGFSGNALSAASGDAFTLVWVGRLGTAGGYQALFSMSGGGINNISATYYQPSGYLYLGINNTFAGIYNAGALLNKVVMVTVRCSGGACAWRVGGASPWMNATVGTGVSPSPQLTVGADINRWSPQVNNTSALFWVYGDALTDAELDANFQYAGETLNARGGFVLDGYAP